MSGVKNRPDWAEIQNLFHEYIDAYQAGNARPDCRDALFSAIYQAVEYLSILRYRQYAGRGTRQTELALDGVQNRIWKIDWEESPPDAHAPLPPAQRADGHQEKMQRTQHAQRTFTSLLTEEYRNEAPLGNFLSTVVGNALRDWFREQNRNRKLDLQLHDDLFKEIFEIGISDVPAASMHLAWGVGSHPVSMEEQIEAHELKRDIARLCKRDQQLLELYYFQEMSSAEISEMTGVNQSTVRTQISRAIQSMRAVLAAQ